MSGARVHEDDVIAIRVRERIEELGLTQREAASRSGITERMMWKTIAGQRRLRVAELVPLAKALDTTPNELLGWSE